MEIMNLLQKFIYNNKIKKSIFIIKKKIIYVLLNELK